MATPCSTIRRRMSSRSPTRTGRRAPCSSRTMARTTGKSRRTRWPGPNSAARAARAQPTTPADRAVAGEPRHIVRTAGLDWAQVWRGRHPFNPNSEMRIARLADQAGMSRVGVNLIRIPPGKESFIPHAHRVQEEFIFVLEGAGELTLDGVAHKLGP